MVEWVCPLECPRTLTFLTNRICALRSCTISICTFSHFSSLRPPYPAESCHVSEGVLVQHPSRTTPGPTPPLHSCTNSNAEPACELKKVTCFIPHPCAYIVRYTGASCTILLLINIIDYLNYSARPREHTCQLPRVF